MGKGCEECMLTLMACGVGKDQVDEFYTAAIKAGGVGNGEPGPRPQFGPNYYAAFVKDPVRGINFEVVCREGA